MCVIFAGDVTIPGGMNFTVDSDLNGESPQFTLTCTSTGGPATTVTWTRDSETVSGGMSVLDDPVTAQYTHTLTVTGRLGGQYQCTVSNSKPSTVNAIAQLSVEGSAHNNCVLQAPYPYPDQCTMCCLSADSVMICLSPSTPSPMAGKSVSLNCSVTPPSMEFQWEGPGDTLTPANPSTSGHSILTLSAVKTSQAGEYTCTATVEGSAMNSTVNSTVHVTVRSKYNVHVL